TKDIEALAAIAREYDLDAVRVRVGEREIEIVRRSPRAIAAVAPAQQASAGSSQASGTDAPATSARTKKVTAPLVGVFYRSAAPGEEPFVNVGDRIEAGDTVCTLEAMKIFNEITSDFAGTVVRVMPENGELVALGDDLFWIEP
ncbi:MAG: acetyl-CoA carboxylase biotin carboxyl carrier protein, partial [Vulcanimicrobiaceae bacterium]